MPTCNHRPPLTADLISEPLTRSTEDYLKAIYRLSLGGMAASTSDIAQGLELAPASVSGMLKRLAEQGWVEHVPYRGVRLSPEGRRVALRMLRRHRLIEAYLVAFLGYTWDTVHVEAERLEHAVSDPLVERMAHALGNPRFDPHGDPIPDVDGTIAEFIHVPLVDVAVGETVSIRRVDTRDDAWLRYIAGAALVPGTRVTVLERQPFRGPIRLLVGGVERIIGHELAGDSVVRSRRLIGVGALALFAVEAARAQDVPRIADNSLLLEEAYNQEAGVVQHISLFGWSHRSHDWGYGFTQEWPYRGQRHQLSYQVVLSGTAGPGGSVGLGDVQLNYRYQLLGGEGKRTWVAPRFSISLPTGSEPSGRGVGALGISASIPVSVEVTPVLTGHLNVAGAVVPATKHRLPGVTTAAATVGASAIWAVDRRINLMLESLWTRTRQVTTAGGSRWSSQATLNPAVRWSFNYASGLQIVPAIGYAIDLTDHGDGNQLLLYLSFEHPFGSRR